MYYVIKIRNEEEIKEKKIANICDRRISAERNNLLCNGKSYVVNARENPMYNV